MLSDFDLGKAVLDKCDKFFVYGTLRTGYGNNDLLSDSVSLGYDKTKGSDWVLGDCGVPYAFPPFVVPEEYDHLRKRIVGELFLVDDPHVVINLDALEGHPVWYNRKMYELESGHTAWVYTMPLWSYAQKCDATNVTPEGDWIWRG